MTREELLKIAKPMMVSLEVAKTIPNKTQTRRLLNPQPKLVIKAENERHNSYSWKGGMYALNMYPNNSLIIEKASKWRVGDILWVREPARVTDVAGESMVMDVEYLSDGKKVVKQIPERFIDMSSTGQIIENFDLIKAEWIRDCKGIPNGCIKEMARIFLKITDIRVERLQDISDDTDNFMSEGFSHDSYEIGETLKNKMYSNDTHGECDFEDDCMHDWWINLWNKTAPKGYKWEDNPYVFVYEFEKVEASK